MTDITKDSLIEIGFKKIQDPGVSLEKVINDSEDERVTIAVVHYRNVAELAILIPGGLIYLKVSSIEELITIENSLLRYESNY